MMDLSFFLGRVFGLYMLAVGSACLFRGERMRDAVAEFYDSPALVLITAVFTLIVGLLVLVSHQVWQPNWKGLITLLGYTTTLKGLIHLYNPTLASRMAERLTRGRGYTYAGVLVIVIGLYFCSMTF